jgi:hypothetical protein
MGIAAAGELAVEPPPRQPRPEVEDGTGHAVTAAVAPRPGRPSSLIPTKGAIIPPRPYVSWFLSSIADAPIGR